MGDKSAFNALMDEVCVGRGWCGGIVNDQPMHVTDLLPQCGEVTADQFAGWVFQADNVDFDEEPTKWQPHFDGLRDAFVRHMGADKVDVSLLTFSDC